jgi:PA14 domain
VEYFSNSGLVGPPTPDEGGCIATVNAYWGTATPSAMITGDLFSARYTRMMDAGTYSLTVRADDGFRVKVNGTAIADHWGTSGTIATPLVIPMTLGASSEVSLEYQEIGGRAVFDVDFSDGTPFLTTNTPIAVSSGLGELGAWNMDVFAAPGNPAITGDPTNSMNNGAITPRAITRSGLYIYMADVMGRLHIMNRDGTYAARETIPTGVVSITTFPLTFIGLATECSVGSIETVFRTVSMKPTSCGSGVVPGTYLAANMVFEGSIHEMTVDGTTVYVMDDKFVWKTDTTLASFTAVIGTAAAATAVVDGTDGLSYGLNNPKSLAASGGVIIIGEGSRLLRFDTSGVNTFTGSLLIGAAPIPGSPATTLSTTDTTVADVSAVAFLDSTHVLFAERYRDIVRVIDLQALTVAPVAGQEWVDEGPYVDANNTPSTATTGQLFDPLDIVVGVTAVYVLQDGYSLVHRLK